MIETLLDEHDLEVFRENTHQRLLAFERYTVDDIERIQSVIERFERLVFAISKSVYWRVNDQQEVAA